ncbi:MAG: hypothetical protein Q8M88_17275 [Phenylobacterium sp.]|uniref:hypothetical protein n=1 Tax=Phenylobacterium sp. TaxID=1871053 RepID=UPI002733FBFF|nr:hypothetical protein [Phenylobacterium sp.]MDP3176179.1 hypothetical protein [Phenylobacterium sp.]
MDGAQVHFEVCVRRKPGSGWSLELATEDRTQAVSAAQEMMAEGRAIAVKVTKETLDAETREFRSVSILALGDPDQPKAKKVREDLEPLCVTPQDLYSAHARDRIGRLLDAWLERNRATPFELLHRPDLVEKLEASGTDLQHALQKIAIPEAQDRGISVHELIRSFQKLVERAIERLLKDNRQGLLPNIEKEGFAVAAERLMREPERGYLLGAGVAASLASARTWTEKVSRLLDLVDVAPAVGPPRALALSTIEQLLAEILGSKVGLDDILGHDLDLGGTLAAMTRLAAADAVDALIAVEPSVAKVMPKLSPAAERLGRCLAAEDFADVRTAIARRVLRELMGPRRLRPSDAEGEIDILRGLAMALTAAAGDMLPVDDVQSAFAARSKTLVTGDFVDAFLGEDRSARAEAGALIWLVENVIGSANKRQAGRWLAALISALRFEKDVRNSPDSPATRLANLADLQRSVARSGLVVEDFEPIQVKLGELGGLVEADAKLVAAVAKAQAPALHRISLLLRLAAGEAAPLGPAADRARVEAMKLLRQDDIRGELARSPEQMAQVRDMIQAATLAA